MVIRNFLPAHFYASLRLATEFCTYFVLPKLAVSFFIIAFLRVDSNEEL